jgi:hypothetical protein
MATIASSNFTTMSYTEEATYGEMPASTDLRYTNFTGESLQFTKESISSNNINPSRQVSDLIQTGFQVSGGLNIELGAKSFDEFIEGAMWNNWGTATDVDITATFVAKADSTTPATITRTAGATDPFANIVTGQFVMVTNTTGGSADAADANLGIFQVLSATDDELTLNLNYDVTAESGKTITITANQIKNPKDGLTSVKHSYFFEKAMEDLTPIYYMSYSGCMVNSWTVSAQSSSILTGSFDFMGQTSEIYHDTDGGTAGDGSESDSSKLSIVGDNIMNAVSHVGTIRMDGENVNVTSGTGVYFQSLDFTLSNNLRGVQAIGKMGNVSVSPGQLSVTGNMNAYFQDDTMYEKFVEGNEFSLSYEVVDENGDAYVFFFPRVAVATSTMSAGGNDQDLIENMTWQALMSSDYDSTMIVHRLYKDYSDVPDGVTIYDGA